MNDRDSVAIVLHYCEPVPWSAELLERFLKEDRPEYKLETLLYYSRGTRRARESPVKRLVCLAKKLRRLTVVTDYGHVYRGYYLEVGMLRYEVYYYETECFRTH